MPSRHSKRDSATQSKRPLKLEGEGFREKAVKFAATLPTDSAMCRHLRVHPGTWVEWKNRCQAGEEFFVEFFADINEARAQEEARLVGKIKKAKDWRAAAWLLERRGEGFVAKHEVTGKDGVPLAGGVMPPVTVVVQSAPGCAPLTNPYALPPEPATGG